MNRKFHRYLINAFSARSESDYLAVPEATEKSALLMNEQAKEYLTSSKRLFKDLITAKMRLIMRVKINQADLN